MVMVLVPAIPAVPSTHVTVCPLAVQVPPVTVPEVNVMAAGSVSVTTTAAAVDGPLLVSLRVYVIGPPAMGFAEVVLVNTRSACDPIADVVDAVLFAGLGSVVVAETVAVLTKVPTR